MANTIILNDNIIELKAIDTDWFWYDTLTAFAISKQGVPIHSIHFKPGATGDRCVIRQKGETDAYPRIFDAACADAYDEKVVYYHGEELKPVLDVSVGSFNAGARLFIILSTKSNR